MLATTNMEALIGRLRDSLKDDAEFQSKLEAVGTDDRLRRFLVARQLDVEKTREMIVNHLKWRKENNVESIREAVRNKKFLTGDMPHAEELHVKGLGMLQNAVFAGRARNGDVVVLEVLGGKEQAMEVAVEEAHLLAKLKEYYIGFFEKRAIMYEEMGKRESRYISTVQVRDVSYVSFMPKSGSLGVLRDIITIGMNNYPEYASVIFFINAPSVFSAISAIFRRWLPEETTKKFRFPSKDDLPYELLRHLPIRAIIGYQRLVQGENGDKITEELCDASQEDRREVIGQRNHEIRVSAGDKNYIYFGLKKEWNQKISWKYLNAEEAPKSMIKASILYVLANGASASEKVTVETIPVKGTSAQFPDNLNADEALLVLSLDHTASWISSQTFKVQINIDLV